jgi:hypothetical protein
MFSDSVIAHYDEIRKFENEAVNITVDEIMQIRSNARVVIFDACYNGSFHNPKGYVAGCHVFGKGRCVVAQGNTVNVLQDKWEDKMLGIIGLGQRVGMWQKEVPYLEGHMIGDPTYRFTSADKDHAKIAAKLHNDLVFNSDNAKVWKKYLKSDNPVLRSVAVTYLGYMGQKEGSDIALNVFENDPSWIVRMHALNTLRDYSDENMLKAIRNGINDPYELIVRHSCDIAADAADKSMVELLEKFISEHPEMVRATYKAKGALDVIKVSKGYQKFILRAADKEGTVERRVDAIRTFRNNKVLEAIPVMLDILRDSNEDEYLRTCAAEVLGWYFRSTEKAQISQELENILNSGVESERIMKEIVKTLKRLN